MVKLFVWLYPLGLLLWLLITIILYGLLFCLVEIRPLRLAYFPYFPSHFAWKTGFQSDFLLFCFFLIPTASYFDSFIDESRVLNLSMRHSLMRWIRYLYLFLNHLLVVVIAPLVTRLVFSNLFSVVSLPTFLPVTSSEQFVFILMGFSVFASGLYLYLAPQDEMRQNITHTYLSQL
ncbi:hypothetical protein H6F89_34445 [Cyanobacteria bacterium FACHB-63]|nr:hypothetical protein [Cyanobacteria bacterium FACHB-63]